MASVIADNWKQALKQEGVTTNDVRIYADISVATQAMDVKAQKESKVQLVLTTEKICIVC